MDHEFHANVAVIKQALVRHELPARIDDAQGQEAWKMYWSAAYSFCENKWPERVAGNSNSQTTQLTSTLTMGVQGLLPALKSVIDQVHVSKYAENTVGVDASGWLY
uniref:XPG N-terminal domain-containing protein n=1 Tax=Hyaloperonospora arabidopsidis (strain Emoy2) TaxID=559515 RepID=M4C2Y4_HYAAE